MTFLLIASKNYDISAPFLPPPNIFLWRIYKHIIESPTENVKSRRATAPKKFWK